MLDLKEKKNSTNNLGWLPSEQNKDVATKM